MLMNSGHMLLTIVAFVFLTTVLLSFYSLLASNGDTMTNSQDGILATTLATSYMEIASGLAFDERTDTSDAAIRNPGALSTVLGRESASEDSIYHFNDFDDFNNFSVEEVPNGTTRRYKTTFSVSYVNPGNAESISGVPTFVKRMDLKTWRTFPRGRADTLKLSMVMGYFHFD